VKIITSLRVLSLARFQTRKKVLIIVYVLFAVLLENGNIGK